MNYSSNDTNTKSMQPLVSIVTPVYNAEKYFTECIESVLSQTYENWEYVIVNNCSTDNSLSIAEIYAKKDSRIRVITNKKFLDMHDSLNNSMRMISSESIYCKPLHADDFLYPGCIEDMVNLALKNPKVGLVGSYALRHKKIVWDGLLTYNDTVVSGHKICRDVLLTDIYVFGTPTTTLLRADLVRKHEEFYNKENPNPDAEVCFNLLQDSDFGFLHKVLSYTREHDKSQTSRSFNAGTYVCGRLIILQKYGRIYLSRKEYKEQIENWNLYFCQIFLKYLLRGRGIAFLRTNLNKIKKFGQKMSLSRCIWIFIKGIFRIRIRITDGGIIIKTENRR